MLVMIMLDALDKAILAELARDPFASNSVVAKKVAAPHGTVSARIALLHREKVSQILAVLDLDLLNQTFCIVRLRIGGRAVEDVAAELATRRLVMMVSELADGDDDMLLVVRFGDYRELDEVLYGDLAHVAGLRSWTVTVILDVSVFKSEYTTHGLHYQPPDIKQNVRFLRDDVPAGLCDDIDLQIIAHLQQNAHQSINSIARKLHINAGTARYRINALKSSGLLHFTRVTDRQAAGIETITYVELDAELGRIDAIIASLNDKEWLPQLFRCAGRAAIAGFVLTSGIDEVLRIRREELMTIDGVGAVRLLHLNRTFKNDYRWTQRVD